MEKKKKASAFIDEMVKVTNRKDAINILNDILKSLYLTSDYTFLVSLKDSLNNFEVQFKDICEVYKKCEKNYANIDDIRTQCAFMYREVNDELSFDIDRLKVHHEQDKTVRRYDAMINLKEKNEFNAKSASALRELLGGDAGYREYVSLSSVSYGLWREKWVT